jgi:hypothetical protein
MIKKMMLLATAVGVCIAFAAPAGASASPDLVWETGQQTLGLSTGGGDQVVHFTGTLSLTKGALKISCNATANATLWNDPTLGAHGEVNSLTFSPDPIGTHGCTVAVFISGWVDIPNCHVETTAQFNTNPAIWTVTTSSTGVAHDVTLDHAEFTNVFTGTGCSSIGIPSGTKVSDTGDAEGVAGSNGDCIVFNNSGTFTGGSTIDGELCATGDLRLTTTE